MQAAPDAASPAALGAPAKQAWPEKADRVLGLLVEIPAAILVVAEVVVLFSGIVARYVFHRPLIWSDELASTLFLWLAMLGAVIALRRGEHMRMTALIARLGPAKRDFFDTLGVVAGLGFLVLIAAPAFEWALEESFVVTPAMEISAAWRASAFPIGVGLMIAFSLIRLLSRTNLAQAALALGLVAVLMVVLWLLGPTLKTLGNLNLVVFFVGIVGASVFAVLQDGIMRSTEYWRALLGGVILLLVLAFPAGIVGGLSKLVVRRKATS